MFGTFPYEPEPDGAVFGPHHFYLGVIVILLVCWMVYDSESDTGPWIVAGGVELVVEREEDALLDPAVGRGPDRRQQVRRSV